MRCSSCSRRNRAVNKALQKEEVAIVLSSDDNSSDDSDDSDDSSDTPARPGKRKAASVANKNIKNINKIVKTGDSRGRRGDDEEYDGVSASDDTDDGTPECSDTEDSDEPVDKPDGVEQRVVDVPLEALQEFENKAAGVRNEVLAMLVKVDGKYQLLFLDQQCDRTSCVLTDSGEEQFTHIMQSEGEVVAWVHSHPGHDLFLSHIDVHTQLGWQALGAFSLVWAPQEHKKWAAYYLNDQQVRKATECDKKNGRAINNGTSCVGMGEPNNYTEAEINLTGAACEVVDSRREH